MPKVLPEYLQQRREQIIDAACSCFARNGFHQSTMQDICREAELSPGAVYRYFRSKKDLIQAIGEDNCQREIERIEKVKQLGDMRRVLEKLAEESFAEVESIEGCIDVDLWAEATRSPAIREGLATSHAVIRDAFAALAREGQARGELNSDLDPVAIARVFMSLFHGLVLQKELEGGVDVRKYTEVVKALATGDFWRGRQDAAADSRA